ncbi:MAG: hypothetical protein ABW275_03825, partial [Hansschlegelia sp.]
PAKMVVDLRAEFLALSTGVSNISSNCPPADGQVASAGLSTRQAAGSQPRNRSIAKISWSLG